jgi:hypothetical protein
MADIKFSCPHCDQRITCDALWGGHELQCPSCQETLTVPAPEPAAPAAAPVVRAIGASRVSPPPPAGHAPKLAISQSTAPAASAEGPSGPQRVIPIRNLTPPPAKKKSPILKYATAFCVLIGLGVGGYFGYFWVRGWQERANAKREAAEQNSGGGEAGHIVALNKALDATEPGRGSVDPRMARVMSPRQRSTGVGQEIPVSPDGSTNAAGASANNAPVIPAVWTLDLGTAKIPEEKVNGMISGTNFVAGAARVDPVGTAQVLRLVQGSIASPDREILVYLHLKAGERLGGQSLAISREMMGSGVPQVAKRWKPNPKFAPQLKSFYNGYAMKLELGQVADNSIPGKIFLALPDPEQTVVAGVFKATVAVIDPNAQPQPSVADAPTAPGAIDPSRAAGEEAMRRRYGRQ